MSAVPESRLAFEEDYRSIFEAAGDGLVIYDIELERVVEANPAACKMHGYSRQEFIGLNPNVFMLPESHVLFREHLRMAKMGGTGKSHVVHLRRDGSPLHAEVHRSAINYQGRPCLLSVIRDVHQTMRTEKTLRGQVEARVREQATLLAISHTLASTLEFQPALILAQLREIVEYTRGGLFLLEGTTLVTAAMRGTSKLEHSAPFCIDLQHPDALAALSNGNDPLCIANLWSDDPRVRFLRSLLEDQPARLLEGMQSWMWVPLAVKDRVLGGIGVAHKKPNYFTHHHARLALSVANQAAITKYNSELYGHAQALAVLEERQRLAQTLHDAINQSLFSANMIAEVLPRLWEKDPADARQSLEDLRTLMRGAMAEMRALLVELRPSSQLNADLGDLLSLLGNAFTGRTNIPVNVTVTGHADLPAEVELAIYHLCQEALNNIAKRNGASTVEICLKHEDAGIELRICDDGRNLDPKQTALAQHDLSVMRERAQAVGAILSSTHPVSPGHELIIRWHKTSHMEVV